MLRNIQGWQLVILLVVIILIFGAARLPNAARSLGKSMKIFKREVQDLREDDEAAEDGAADGGTAEDDVAEDDVPDNRKKNGGAADGGAKNCDKTGGESDAATPASSNQDAANAKNPAGEHTSQKNSGSQEDPPASDSQT